ncbi:transcriptional regulatory protein c terminal [Lucifera butyrica]|uniref:Transcriptional regulatory protein c terminal n=2 Tax=Lucifera butyrica TaxID=1351585 RepID=A0A498RBH0_9FIRM|nr:transcriptional regulatory protein c terminal [Lucifera butyrica]
MAEKKKILIVEDEYSLARSLQLELAHADYQTEIVNDGLLAFRRFQEKHWDLLLLDRMLPGMEGSELCRFIRRSSDIPIIMLTALGATTDITTSLDGGADDYITKPFDFEELLARIRVQLRNHADGTRKSQSLQIDDLFINRSTRKVKRAAVEVSLSRREFDLLFFLMSNNGMVLKREVILDKVWGYDYEGGANVVDVYISWLRDKIDKPFGKALIQTVRGVGYSLREK